MFSNLIGFRPTSFGSYKSQEIAKDIKTETRHKATMRSISEIRMIYGYYGVCYSTQKNAVTCCSILGSVTLKTKFQWLLHEPRQLLTNNHLKVFVSNTAPFILQIFKIAQL
jgi:hypothetical protein